MDGQTLKFIYSLDTKNITDIKCSMEIFRR